MCSRGHLSTISLPNVEPNFLPSDLDVVHDPLSVLDESQLQFRPSKNVTDACATMVENAEKNNKNKDKLGVTIRNLGSTK